MRHLNGPQSFVFRYQYQTEYQTEYHHTVTVQSLNFKPSQKAKKRSFKQVVSSVSRADEL